MKITVCENYEEMSNAAARLVSLEIKTNPLAVLGLATGSTPIGMYEKLVEMYKSGELDFSRIKTFNLDEYYPVLQKNEQSYHYFMKKHLFNYVNINPENTHIPNGECEDPALECKNYEALMEKEGGIDLQILGIGNNGHIGFNEPGEDLSAITHLVHLTESTVGANSRFFESADDVPRMALTMGIGSIMKAKKIIILASGDGKRDIIAKLLSGKITTKVPASVLNVHSDVTLICDKAAYPEDKI